MSGYVAPTAVATLHSIDSARDGLLAPQTIFALGTLPTANLAIYTPVVVRKRVVVTRLWYGNLTTATGNYDIGLYDAAGVALLRRGSTAKTTASADVEWDCADTTIGPGVYYLALVSSNTTDTFVISGPAAPMLAAVGVYTEASALPLPATATFALDSTLAAMPLVGMYCQGGG